MTDKLNAGDQFPGMTVAQQGGGEITLPLSMDAGYQVVLFYRGSF